jgi:DNA-binding protein Fis
VLTHTEGQIGEAARILGVHRNTLARKIRDYGL